MVVDDEHFDLAPTHRCFDDVFDFLSEQLERGGRAALDQYRVVHAVCRAPDGHLYGHAWVEQGNEVWQAAVVRGGKHDGARAEYWAERGSFLDAHPVEESTSYTAFDAIREQHRTRSNGPWIATYRVITDACSEEGVKEWLPSESRG